MAAACPSGSGIPPSLFGVLTLAPLAARPLARVVGAPLRLRGMAGDLARQNAMRNPRRTASTAAALMIGLTLVVGMGVFASSLKASFGDRRWTTRPGRPVPHRRQRAGATASARRPPGWSRTSPVWPSSPPTGWGKARFDGADATYSSVDPATVERVLDLDLTAGSSTGLGTDGVLVAADTAAEPRVGGRRHRRRWSSPRPGGRTCEVRGIFDRNGFLDSDYS